MRYLGSVLWAFTNDVENDGFYFCEKDQQHRTGNIFFYFVKCKNVCVLLLCTAQGCINAFPSHPSPRWQHTNLPSQYVSIKVPMSPNQLYIKGAQSSHGGMSLNSANVPCHYKALIPHVCGWLHGRTHKAVYRGPKLTGIQASGIGVGLCMNPCRASYCGETSLHDNASQTMSSFPDMWVG